MVLLLESPTGEKLVELVRDEPTLAGAVVGGVREMELAGSTVLGVAAEPAEVAPARQPHDAAVVWAADLILRLRRLGPGLTEEDMALLLELLPF